MFNIASQLLSPVMSFLCTILKIVLFFFLLLIFQYVIRFFLACRCVPFLKKPDELKLLTLKKKSFDFLRWVIVDFKERGLHSGDFRECGFTFFVGRQGSGKTTAMVEYLERMRIKYPKCIIVTNFKYAYADFIMVDWLDLMNVRNGLDGVIFAIDEIHSEYSSASSKDIPENLLSEVSQQRKQRIKIVATTQFYSRVAKPLREQANDVVSCSNFFGRLIRTVRYDALEYSSFIDNIVVVQKKLKPLGKYSFISSDALRSSFDTYEKINRMRKIENKNAGYTTRRGKN